MDSLELLSNHLNQALGERKITTRQWGQSQLMTKALAEVQKVFDNPISSLSERSIEKVLREYRQSGHLPSFLDLKYACFGIVQPVDAWRLLNDEQLFATLLHHVDDTKLEPRRFRKCYQGLLAGYFNYPIFDKETVLENWKRLRQFLTDHLPIVREISPPATWASMLNEHENLLGTKPCIRYARELLTGNSGELRSILYNGLGIARESWVWQGVVLSQMKVACGYEDKSFQEDLDRLLRIIEANSDILSGRLTIQCVAALTIRYAECREHPEHGGLRDAAIGKIGNPWLKKTSWDVHVKTKDGQPHEDARQMVNGWLKRRLIKDFFEILSDDGTADQRRLDYWLRFEPIIEDMWFALGPHAQQHRGQNFKEFKKMANGRLLRLDSPGSAQNNAFIMRLGEWIVVEFGAKGNACFVFNAENLPFDLSKDWVNGNDTGLKSKRYRERFVHRDSSSSRWEQKLNNIIGPLIRFSPSIIQNSLRAERTPRERALLAPDRDQAMIAYIRDKLKLPIEDNRAKGGALWVLVDSEMTMANQRDSLIAFGFKHRPGKGWWKE